MARGAGARKRGAAAEQLFLYYPELISKQKLPGRVWPGLTGRCRPAVPPRPAIVTSGRGRTTSGHRQLA